MGCHTIALLVQFYGSYPDHAPRGYRNHGYVKGSPANQKPSQIIKLKLSTYETCTLDRSEQGQIWNRWDNSRKLRLSFIVQIDWIWFQWLSPCPIFISRIQNRVSVQKQAGRKYIEELVKRPMPFIAKYKTRGTASENISTANHIIPQKKLYSSLLSVHVDYIF